MSMPKQWLLIIYQQARRVIPKQIISGKVFVLFLRASQEKRREASPIL
jgi:hypothetical protein